MSRSNEPISAYAVYSQTGKKKQKKGVFNLSNKVVSNGIKLNNNISILKSEDNKHKADLTTQINNPDGMKKLYKQRVEEVVLKKKNRKRKKSNNSLSENEESKQKCYIAESKVIKKTKIRSNTSGEVQKKENRADSPYIPNIKSLAKKKCSKFKKHKDLVSARPIKEESSFSQEDEEEEEEVQEVEEEDDDVIDIEDSQDNRNVSVEDEVVDDEVEDEGKQNQTANESSSVVVGKQIFEWVIKPVTERQFMSDYWEKQPLFVTRNQKHYYSTVLSTPIMDKMLHDNVLYYGTHIDITSYSDGKRETHNQEGRALPHVVWDYYLNGCSVRLLNPQTFIPKIHTLNATLQEYFGCFVGANVYLTPAGSQGFAPHYDDIEAFVLQIEGKKHWRVYPPRNTNEKLPRFSSPNFTQDEIGTPILDVILKAGDLLYFPRGYIHQAVTLPDSHSLHITLSVYQKTAWIDLLEKALPEALLKAAKVDAKFREGLPRGYLDYAGLARANEQRQQRKQFISKAKQLVEKLVSYLDVDSAVDKMGIQFMHDALPPILNPDETKRSVFEGGLTVREEGKVSNRVEIQLGTEVKLIRAHCCRIIKEEEEFRLYHTVDNSLEYHAEDPQYLVIPPETVQIVQLLITKYPHYVTVQSIPHNDEDEKLRLVSDLWDRGLLLTSVPLNSIDIDDDED